MVKLQTIAERVRLSRRYVRSTDLVRDLNDPHALDGYVLTASAREALLRLRNGLANTSAQRAFRVTGPYGSGKSSFGLLLARLAAEGLEGGPASDILGRAGADWRAAVDRHLPIVISGRHTGFAAELARVVEEHATAAGAADAIAILHQRDAGDPGSAARRALDALDQYARHVHRTCGARTILLVDEMGRFVEFAAAHPRTEDPSIFQQLAERAGGRDGCPLAVIAFLHHRFSDYVAGLGEWIEAEWTRSAERYEELPFRHGLEQTLFLLAGALTAKPAHARAVADRARSLYRAAGDAGVFSLSTDEIADLAPQLYPLHPASVSAVSAMARRLGQNERSIFGFLQSMEPHGFQRYAQMTSYGGEHWYRLPQLFDYLATQGSLRFTSPDLERRWHLAQDALAQLTGDADDDRDVLKCVALVAVLEPMSGIRADAKGIAWCLGIETEAADRSLSRLIERNLLYRRPQSGDHSLWSSSSVDLGHWLEEARIRVPAISRLDQAISALPPARPLLAHRHFQTSGTLRSFAITMRALSDTTSFAHAGPSDGDIAIVAVHPDDDSSDADEQLAGLSTAAGPMTLVQRHDVKPSDLKWAHQLAMWRWVRENCSELRVDDLARSEVSNRIAQAETALTNALAPMGRSEAGRWWQEGTPITIADRKMLSRRLSETCDRVFHAAPVLRNELINRSKLSTAVASARMRLLELMIDRAELPMLGLTGAPPERTIHLAMFHVSGLHREISPGVFGFAPPSADDPKNWGPAWLRLKELLNEGEAVHFSKLTAELAKAPWGLRGGPALLLIIAFMLHARRDVALMERNSFQPEITPAHFMRLAKKPANFALRYMGDDAPRRDLVELLNTGLAVMTQNRPAEASVKSVVESLYRWFGSLTPFAMETTSVSATAQSVRTVLRKATDPLDVIFEQLPRACGARADVDPQTYVEVLDAALLDLDEAEPKLRLQAAASLASAFGVRDAAAVRNLVQTDYGMHRGVLTDYPMRQFVDRALSGERADDRWLDGIAGLLVTRRIESWDDGSLDAFSFKVREMADRLARWLFLIRRAAAASMDVTSVHVVTTTGKERVMLIRPETASRKATAAEAAVLKLIADIPDAHKLLGKLLVERLDRQGEKTKT